MKNVKTFLKVSFAVVLSFFFIQCAKDDTTPKQLNTVKFNGKDFPIVAASMIGISIDDHGHTGITLVSGSGTKVTTLTIDVESFTNTTIVGKYNYPKTTNSKELDDWLTNYAVFDDSNLHTSNLQTGEVTISHNGGNNYTVEMNLKMVDGATFSGKYKGDFQVIFSNQ
jgi:hypothetical protein